MEHGCWCKYDLQWIPICHQGMHASTTSAACHNYNFLYHACNHARATTPSFWSIMCCFSKTVVDDCALLSLFPMLCCNGGRRNSFSMQLVAECCRVLVNFMTVCSLHPTFPLVATLQVQFGMAITQTLKRLCWWYPWQDIPTCHSQTSMVWVEVKCFIPSSEQLPVDSEWWRCCRANISRGTALLCI